MASASVNPLGQSSLAKRLGWTFLLLCCYRIGVHVPIPGVDAAALAAYFKSLSGTLFDMFDMFSGGGLSNVSVFALGVMPYISASIIMQLLQVVSPDIKRMAKEEGQAGRRKITQYTRYLTVLITLVQGLFISIGLESMTSPDGTPIVLNAGWHFRMVTMATFTAGSMLVMWLGEQITERGIGNGISLIIFCGIVVGIPRGIMQSMDLIKSGSMSIFLAVIIVLLMAAVLTAIVFVERAQRRIPISYAKRQIGRKMFGGQNTHLPLRVNTAGVIPPIFASSLLLFPATVGQFSTNEYVRMVTDFFAPHGVLYNVLYVVLIFFFCYFYTAIIIDPKDMAENLKKNGGFVPGIRPGERTQEYIDTVLSRLTLSGAVYISAISLLPMLMIAKFNVPFYFGGTSLLILVGVAMDFMNQVESHMISTQYQGLMNKAARKGGRM
ncbi:MULTISPECIES: preprotein translocase subunit SecY [Desulfovibrio]|jgi:preprotein translocase subunit SecY|uniref:Protein translocase subunit SecY n=3 Tax=Thermodesulfobacteriota TaxID=200940 RepID=A0A848CHJ1_9BACT|nr:MULTISPECIES: preprotein translocase subunit SecY [Desulfovibrio]MBM6834809.1 preprotein translocase subunit SecY [Desulfovibrio piger]MBM6893916.1 preprotein translocase subunit SecY [Desulfovibrio piger]MBR2609764.1 preprotein translocase subunit SecY [Desulfovibrio sp.]MBS5808842.1 preprotein translocase subunit SecY [Desulfovibrio piger]MCI6941286.1 preprotein translocase subunit SecY [Desulfovibrio piger]